MASLKDLRNRIKSVKATQKITKAMKMVAASKLRRAREAAEASRPYADHLQRMLSELSASMKGRDSAPKLLIGTGKDDVHLLIVATSDRGLCGAFNSSILRSARREIQRLRDEGKQVKLFCIGRKGYEQLKRDYSAIIVGHLTDTNRQKLGFEIAHGIAARITAMYEAGEFDTCTVVYNTFKSAINQVVTYKQLVPLPVVEVEESLDTLKPVYESEPSEGVVLEALLPHNLAVQVLYSLLENAASEQGARMTAMDNATRNAGEMIKKLTLVYNRTRQAAITKELIEIISGAEAL